MTSIKDVAKKAGVSTATVSRVLANSASTRPETRERVMRAVADLNYRPNLTARSLRTQTSPRIGLVVSDIRNPFFTGIGRAVEDTAYEQGYSVLMCNTDENPEKEVLYLNLLQDQNIAGVIFSPTQHFNTATSAFRSGIPFVIIDRTIDSHEVDMVLLDNVSAAYELACHLIENGYRRIAGLFGNASTTGKDRQRGLRKALAEHHLEPAAIHFIEPRIKQGYEAALKLLAQDLRPDAIFTSNSMLTAGAFRAIRECNLSIPDEIGLVGFDETTWGQLVEPPVTVIAQPNEDIGRTATELLFQRIEDPDRAPKTVILKGKLLARGSTMRG